MPYKLRASRAIAPILVAALCSAITGAATYLYQRSDANRRVGELDKQVNRLQAEIGHQSESGYVTVLGASRTITADQWSNYWNDEYGFGIYYPPELRRDPSITDAVVFDQGENTAQLRIRVVDTPFSRNTISQADDGVFLKATEVSEYNLEGIVMYRYQYGDPNDPSCFFNSYAMGAPGNDAKTVKFEFPSCESNVASLAADMENPIISTVYYYLLDYKLGGPRR